jgi:hypothetical protein
MELTHPNGALDDSESFGPFEAICRSGGYLALLGMAAAGDAAAVLTAIAGIVGSTVDHRLYVNRMFEDRNWRGQLIAMAAVLVSTEAASHASALWRCFDRGSWVAPQLAVSLYCSDPGFAERAKARIAARCPIIDDDDCFRGYTQQPSAKNLASLLRVVTYIPGETSWAASQHRAHDVHELLKADYDASGQIVERWFDAARARFRESGRDLSAAA